MSCTPMSEVTSGLLDSMHTPCTFQPPPQVHGRNSTLRRRAICRTCTPVLSQKSISRADESKSPAVVWKCFESPPKSICITGTVWPRHTAWRRYWYLTPPPLPPA